MSTSTPVRKREQKQAPLPAVRRVPRYSVVLWDDDDHTYHYVIEMMRKLFGHLEETGYKIAWSVDQQGKAVCLTTTLEHAELKRDQIHSYGPDTAINHCQGAMYATIEKFGD